MALTKNKMRQHKIHVRKPNIAPVNAGEVIYVGSYILREAATAVATKVIAAGNVPLGVVIEQMFPDDPDLAVTAALDNTNGDDGVTEGSPEKYERCVRYDQDNEYAMKVTGGTPKIGAPAFLVDDDTVQAAVTATGIIAGAFTRPAPLADHWYVDISRRGIAGGAGGSSADIADLVAIAGGESPTEAEFNALQTTVNSILAALRKAGILV